jgi:RNA polymerase sigma-70 factor (ECF subfamily)
LHLQNHDRAASLAANTPENELVSRAATGDIAAFTVLMRCHNQLLFRTARSILRNDADAEDAVQEGYLHAWRALGKFNAQSRLSTWLVRIVVNEALGRLRRRRAPVIPLEAAMISHEPEIHAALTEPADHGSEQSVLRTQIRRMLESRIDLLPEIYRTVFMLRAVEEMSVEEVAQALDIPQATVRTRFFRARSLLREGLAGEVDTTIGEVFSFDGARCDRMVAGVLARIAAGTPDMN